MGYRDAAFWDLMEYFGAVGYNGLLERDPVRVAEILDPEVAGTKTRSFDR